MPLTEHPSDKPIHIQSFSNRTLIINEKSYSASILITADFQILPWDGVSLEPLLQGEPEVVLLGTGDKLNFLTPAQMAVFYQRGIGVEAMTTAAAIRTYTVLTSEERKVSVGLII